MMYTLFASFILSRVMDAVQQGAYSARGLLIISDKYKEIGQMIDLKLSRGFTYLEAKGGYKEENRPVIYVVVEPREVPAIKDLIKQEDRSQRFLTSLRTVSLAFLEFLIGAIPKLAVNSPPS